MIWNVFPYLISFTAALALTLVLTPLVRELNRRLGMVDKPDARRINVVPIPRGGGLALILGVYVSYAIFHFVTGRPWIQGLSDAQAYRMTALSAAIAALGFADDKFSLTPRVKLAGQIVVAALVWSWAGLGFRTLWPHLPLWIDCVITVFWIVGAVNAFNLIDGLDGLATGLAFIAVIGLAGGVFFVHNPQGMLFYFAMAGGLLGFLRYNYNPASVFLGDCGSMFLGFIISTLPLASQVPNSFIVSVGVPLLAMGVPIFDTSLAILRRSLRHLLAKRGVNASKGSGEVMTADVDHLHHRILREVGLNQRKAAWIIYAMAAGCVIVGLTAAFLDSRAAGLWLVAMTIVAVVVFKDAKIELFDAGRLLSEVAHSRNRLTRRRLAFLSVPFYVFADLVLLTGVTLVCMWALKHTVDVRVLRTELPIRVVSTFAFLVLFRTYTTLWSRALGSNFFRLFLACCLGSVTSSAFVYYWPSFEEAQIKGMTLAFAFVSFASLFFVRVVRSLVRDLFYAVDCSRLKQRKDVSRVIVYGAGLRYRAFRRELVRTTAANDRMIVGILDDDALLKGRYIGGIRICGTIDDAPKVINELNADAIVIACKISDEWLSVVRRILAPTGVKLSVFSFSETEL